MKLKAVTCLVLTLILIGMSTLAFKVQPTQADHKPQLLLETDKDVYILGENVTILLVNIGTESVSIGGYPAWQIFTYPEEEPVYPEIFAFLAWSLDPGENDTFTWNQYNEFTQSPAEPGMYVIKDTQGLGLSTYFKIIAAEKIVPDDYPTIQEGINATETFAPLIWNFTTGGSVYAVCVSSDNEYIIAGSDDRNIYCLDLASGRKIWNYDTGEWSDRVLISIYSVFISPDNKYVIAGTASNVYCFNINNGNKIWNYTTGETWSVFVSPDSEYVIAGSHNGNIYKLNITDGTEIWRYQAGHSVHRVFISSDNRYVAAGLMAPYAFLNEVICLDMDGNLIWNYDVNGDVVSLSISPNSKYVIAGSGGNVPPPERRGRIYALNITNGQQIWNYTATGVVDTNIPITSIYVSSDSKYVAAGTGNGITSYLSITDGSLIWNYSTGDYAGDVSISPNGRYVVVGGNEGLFCLDSINGNKMWNYTTMMWNYTTIITSVFVSSDNRYVIAGSLDHNVYAFSLAMTPVHNIDTSLDYTTIQEAINAPETLDGHTIFVEEGRYYENIIVAKNNLSLVGEDPNDTIIDGSRNGTVVSLEANNCNVSCFTIRNSENSDWDCGVCVHSSGNTLRNNIVISNRNGIMIQPGSDDNILINNIVNANWVYGIHLWYSDNSVLNGNTATDNYDGIIMEFCSNTTLRNNTISHNVWNFGVGGEELPYFIHDIDTSNKVEGKPIQYLINKENIVVDSTWVCGYLCVVNSTNVTVKDLTLNTPSWHGIQFAHTTNSRIENVTVSGTSYAIKLVCSSNNIIMKNHIFNRNGIELWKSNDNTIIGNSISRNGIAVLLFYSSNNTIMNNDINNNWRGLFLYSSNNKIFHNSFVNNDVQVLTENGYTNTWDDGYPSGGNYWSDHVCTGNPSDGSQPYIIDANNIDHYPFQDPDGWLPPHVHDVAVMSVTPSSTEVTSGESVNITVVVKNNGTETESFHVTVYYNTIEIDTETVTDLAAGATKTLTFTWNTTGLEAGNYTIKAEAETLNGETYTANNAKVSVTDIVVTPEFPSWTSILLILTVFSVAIAIYKRRLLKTPAIH